MTRIAAAEAKNRFAELIDRVQAGEEIEVTKYGHPVAKIVAIKRKRTEAEVDALMKRVEDNAAKLNLRFDWEEWKAYRDEGRR